MIEVNKIVRSDLAFIMLASGVSASLFLPAGYLNFLIFALFLFSLLNYRAPSIAIRHYKVLFLPVCLYVMYVVWLFPVANLSDGLNLVFRKLPLLLLPLSFILIRGKIDDKSEHIILDVFLVSCLLCSLVCYFFALENVIANKSFSVFTERKYYYFSFLLLTEPVNISPIYLSLYTNLAIVIALKSALLRRKGLRLFVCLYLILFVILISSKVGIITLVMVLLVWLMLKKQKPVLYRVILILLIPLFAIGIYSFPFLNERFLAPLEFNYAERHGHLWNSNSLRLAIWSCAVEAIRERPILGYGTSGGQKALEYKYKEKDFEWALSQSYNPHNEFLSTQLDLGVLGTCLFAFTLVAMMTQSIQSKNIVFIGFMMMVVISFLVESTLMRQKGIVFFSFYSSLFLRREADNRNKKSSEG